MIHDPNTTQRDTETHTFGFIFTRPEVDIIGDGFIDFTTIPVLHTKNEISDILWNNCVSKLLVEMVKPLLSLALAETLWYIKIGSFGISVLLF